MNKTSLVIGLTISLAAASGTFAEEKKVNARVSAKGKEMPSKQTEGIATGSHLKQAVRRNGFITDSSSHVLVIDRGAIERSGASDVKQLLIRYGGNR